MIVIWTAAQAEQLRRTIGASLKAMRPNVPEHRFEAFEPGKLVVPAKGEIVLACGSKPLALLQESRLLPKGRTLNSLREHPLKPKADGGFYMMTFDPGIVSSEPDKRALIDWDVRLANRLLTTGSLVPPVGDYQWVGSFAPLIARIEAKYEAIGQAGGCQLRHGDRGAVPLVSRQGLRLDRLHRRGRQGGYALRRPQARPGAGDRRAPPARPDHAGC